MRVIKSYLMYTSRLYQLLVLVLFPVFIFILGGIMVFAIDSILAVIFFVPLIVFVEVFGDFWAFGGISTKDYKGFEFLKTSKKGKQFLFHALLGDCLRKIIWIFVIIMGVTLYLNISPNSLSGDGENSMMALNLLRGLASVFLCYSIVLAGNFVGRYLIVHSFLMLLGYGGAVLGVCAAIFANVAPVPALVLGIALAIGFSWLNIWNITRKMEGSYYDKTV